MVVNKKLSFEIIVDDDSLKNLGLEKVSIINRNIIINLPNGQTIFSTFKIENLEGTIRGLNKKLIDKGMNADTIKRLESLLTDKINQKLNELERQKQDSAPITDVRKIEEEIEKDRISIGEISEQQWQAGVLQRYQKLKNEIDAKLPSLWPMVK